MLTRRSFLASAAMVTVAPGSAGLGFDVLRLRWRGLVLGSFDPKATRFRARLEMLGRQAGRLHQQMAPVPGSLWPDLVHLGGTSASVDTAFGRLLRLSQAWAQPGTGLTGDARLLSDVLAGLEQLHAEVYNASQVPYGNWWDWQIGVPHALFDLCAILYDHLPAAQLADLISAVGHFVPDSAISSYQGTSTGANRVDLCRSVILSGIFARNPARLAIARDALTPVFLPVTSGDGFYADGSFIQHTAVPYTGTYGGELLDGLAHLAVLLKDSPWAITGENWQLILDSVERSYAPFLFNGLMMDGVSGRAISRGGNSDHSRGARVIAGIALLARSASPAEAERWKGLVKGWAARSALLDDPRLSLPALGRCTAIVDDPRVRAAPEPVGHSLFLSMARTVHRSRKWAASISMSTPQVAFYEHGNGENVHGWHTGSGMLYWWDSHDDRQYTDGFWPTVDPYRLPGTTISTRRLADAEGGRFGGARPAAGSVTGHTDGVFAVVGQDLRGLSSTLTGRKSWFFLPDAIICLGAGITCTDGVPVESIYDNRRTAGTLTHGDGWAHIAGSAGYAFLDRLPVTFLHEERTGAWHDLNTGGSTTPMTRRYVTIYRDHGADPIQATYAYMILPRASVTTTAKAAGQVSVLANTPDIQAISVPSCGLTAATFFTPGTLGDLTAMNTHTAWPRRPPATPWRP